LGVGSGERGAMRAPSATRLASLVYGFAEGLAHQDSGEKEGHLCPLFPKA
jgi:hypothetical protein